MPGGDRTGPLGQGSKTGRAAGYCAGYHVPGFANFVPGRRFPGGRFWNRGRGRGKGRGYWAWSSYPFYPSPHPSPVSPFPASPESIPCQPSPQEEMDYLKEVAETLKKELDSVHQRINELSEETE